MSKKDYVLLAAAIRQVAERGGEAQTVQMVAEEIAHRLANDNHRFDYRRFLAAAVPAETVKS